MLGIIPLAYLWRPRLTSHGSEDQEEGASTPRHDHSSSRAARRLLTTTLMQNWAEEQRWPGAGGRHGTGATAGRIMAQLGLKKNANLLVIFL